jgi:phosphatidylserine/phosphatidylglycerophosphate/cardiolipin synthase-like enzyme
VTIGLPGGGDAVQQVTGTGSGFNWERSNTYRTGNTPWPDGYPTDSVTFFSPEDGEGIHRLIVDLITIARHSVVLNMFGFDDDEANAALHAKALDPNVFFQMSLDKSQAGGVHERALLAPWDIGVGTSISVGQSVKHAISHLKVMIVDGQWVVSGSTNWSLSGEQLQDNQLTVTQNAVLAAQYRSILDINHTEQLRQMAAAALKAAPAPTVPGP